MKLILRSILFIITVNMSAKAIKTKISDQNTLISRVDYSDCTSGTSQFFSPDNSEVFDALFKQNKSNLIPAWNQYKFNLVQLIKEFSGMTIIIFVAFIFSENLKAISCRVAGIGPASHLSATIIGIIL